jgi:RNA polymerase sigma factor (sigma-70 family)
VGRAEPGEATDNAIIKESLTHPEAFGTIFDRHAPAVHRFLSSRAGVESADELLSEVFLAAFRNRRTYDERFGTVLPWLLGIAINMLRHHHRSEARKTTLLTRLGQRSRENDSMVDDIATQVVDRSEAHQVRDAVNLIDPRFRDVLILYAGFELSYDEIAQTLDLRIGTVRSRLSRGRGQLRELLARSGQYITDGDRRISIQDTEGPVQ